MDERLRCKNCGHLSSYHGHPICNYDFGSSRRDRCQCGQFESLELAEAHARIADLTDERDRYMQSMLDLIHDLARHPAPVPTEAEDG